MHFLFFSLFCLPSVGLGRSGCTVGLWAEGSRRSIEGSVAARVPGGGRWTARRGNGQTPSSTHCHTPLQPSHLHRFNNTSAVLNLKCFQCYWSRNWTELTCISPYSCLRAEKQGGVKLSRSLTMVEVELCDGQQDSGKRQIQAEPPKESLDARERSVDQRGVLDTHEVQDTHSFDQTLREETGQTAL